LIMQVCTLSLSSDIYCPDTYSIFHLEIQKRLKIIEEYYSPEIAQIVQDCLQYDPDERPEPAAILQRLKAKKGNDPL
jgi:serine/threonine protein kinase